MLLVKFHYQITLFLHLDKSAGNWHLLALFFSRDRFMMAALNDFLNRAFDCREKLLIFWEPADLAHLQNYSQRK